MKSVHTYMDVTKRRGEHEKHREHAVRSDSFRKPHIT